MRRFVHKRLLIAGVSCSALLAACGGERAPARGARSVTDDAGRTVILAAPARRVVSLLPSFTELLFTLGAGERVVGRTEWCDYPPAARAVQSVGDGLDPSVELIAARQPDLVLLYRSPATETAARQLEQLGIPALLLRVDRLADLARAARVVGPLVERTATAESLAAALESVATRAPPPVVARVAFVVWDNPVIVIGRGSYLDELARLAGGSNVFADIASASAQVALETLAARDPDLLVVLSDSATPPAYASRPEWRVVRAVRERRFVYLSGSVFGRPSPRTGAAVAELRRLLEAAR